MTNLHDPISPDTAMRYALTPALTAGERRELLHYLGYPDTVPTTSVTRATAVMRVAQQNAWDQGVTHEAQRGLNGNTGNPYQTV